MFNLIDESFEIDDELRIRQLLDYNTSYLYIFDKSDDKYGYDIESYKYTVFPSGDYRKDFLGYIEVERSKQWNTFDIPNNWYCISFLKRKVYEYDWSNNHFTDKAKFYNQTFYLKFNKDLTNCFTQSMEYIFTNGKDSKRNYKNGKLRGYNDQYIELKKHEVVFGIKESLSFIEGVFNESN